MAFKKISGAYELTPELCRMSSGEALALCLASNDGASDESPLAGELRENLDVEASSPCAKASYPYVEAGPPRHEFGRTRRFFVFDNVELFDETWLFNIYNLIFQIDSCTLFTTRLPPNAWDFKLKDLESRLRGAMVINIHKPDDDLLKRLMVKFARDHGLYIDLTLVDFLIRRLPRTFDSVISCMRELNEISISLKTKISKKIVVDWLARRDLAALDGSDNGSREAAKSSGFGAS
jgi:hypothetical protein